MITGAAWIGTATTGSNKRSPSSVTDITLRDRSPDEIMVPLLIASALSFVAPPCRPMGTLVAAHRPTALVSSPVAVIDVVEPSYNLALGSLALGALFGIPGSPLKSKVCGPLLRARAM